MNDMIEILEEAAHRLFTDLCTDAVYDEAAGGGWLAPLWDRAAAAGLTSAIDPESDDSQPLAPDVLCALIRTTGKLAVPLPLAETLLAQAALLEAGLPALEGPLSIDPAFMADGLTLERTDGQWRLSGTLHRVPWGRHVRGIVAIARCGDSHATVYIEAPTASKLSLNYADEPRDSFVFDALPLPDEHIGQAGHGLAPASLTSLGALWRSAQMAGAMQTALGLTLQYSGERVQFGRPIGKFQAVQQQVAVMAAQVAASAAAVEAAVAAAGQGPAAFEMAAAKARVSEAAGLAIEVSHQVHGAMGFTQEYPLQRYTRRLMAWRDEFGSETEWHTQIGMWVAEAGAASLWPMITSPQDFNHLIRPMPLNHV